MYELYGMCRSLPSQEYTECAILGIDPIGAHLGVRNAGRRALRGDNRPRDSHRPLAEHDITRGIPQAIPAIGFPGLPAFSRTSARV